MVEDLFIYNGYTPKRLRNLVFCFKQRSKNYPNFLQYTSVVVDFLSITSHIASSGILIRHYQWPLNILFKSFHITWCSEYTELSSKSNSLVLWKNWERFTFCWFCCVRYNSVLEVSERHALKGSRFQEIGLRYQRTFTWTPLSANTNVALPLSPGALSVVTNAACGCLSVKLTALGLRRTLS